MTNTELETGLSAVETELALLKSKIEQKIFKRIKIGQDNSTDIAEE
jgi:hypothetical protein